MLGAVLMSGPLPQVAAPRDGETRPGCALRLARNSRLCWPLLGQAPPPSNAFGRRVFA